MAYEIDFIGIDKESKDATAICMRWKNDNGGYTVGVFDGGLTDYGNAMKNHMNKYYFDGVEGEYIDFVICSHPHQDHVLGLKAILENFNVGALYMNRPWLHIAPLFERVKDGRITEKSLEERLKSRYTYIADLEAVANEQGIPIYGVFEGNVIEEKLTVLSPSEEFYLDLLAESDKTPSMESVVQESIVNKIRIFEENILTFMFCDYYVSCDEKDSDDKNKRNMNCMVICYPKRYYDRRYCAECGQNDQSGDTEAR